MKKYMIVGTLVVAAGLFALPADQLVSAAPPDKVLICHVDPDGEGDGPVVISVSVRSLPAHMAHGDCLAEEGAAAGDACDCDPD